MGKTIGELQGGWSILFRLGVAVLPVMLAANLGFTGWQAKAVADNTTKIAAIQASQFDVKDALALWRELAAVREQVASLPLNEPPAWFIDRVGRIERMIGDHMRMHGTQ